jgi:hypothetical protein
MSSLSFDAKALKAVCRDFEARHGIEAFLDTIAGIMQDRLGDYGLNIELFDDEIGDENGEQAECGGDHRSVQRYRASQR